MRSGSSGVDRSYIRTRKKPAGTRKFTAYCDRNRSCKKRALLALY